MRRCLRSLVPMLLLLTAFIAIPAIPTAAQAGERCFSETGLCISGSIRTYWEQNGGLAVFGFPITAQTIELVEGSPLQVQWFERDRLEIQPDSRVTTGRLGAERLEQMGTPWQPGENRPAGPTCALFGETGHQVCGAFLSYWRSNGGLERFGLPLTESFFTELEGRIYVVQYFERRRFEFHPEIGPNAVLLGLLGREVLTHRQAASTPPQPEPTPQPTPQPTPDPGPPIQPPEVLERYRQQMPSGFWQINQNGIQITAVGFEYKQEFSRFSKAERGKKYVAFTLEVANTGYQSRRGGDTFFANSASFDLIDLDGNTHNIDSAMYGLDDYFRGGTFYIGTRSRGLMVFQIGERSAPALLIFDGPVRVVLDLRLPPNR